MKDRDINVLFTYLQSQQTAQTFLYDCYQKLDGIDAATKSYENCNSFMYYLDHGIQFYENGKNLDILFQPIMFFYGMVHLIKANLLTIRPHYPESTTILAHGVSSRKRKKKNYSFMDDEVKTQQNGLFPYFSKHLFSISQSPFEKFKMEDLLGVIPEISPLFTFHNQKKMVVVGEVGKKELHFPNELLDNYHLTAKSFTQRIKSYLPEIEQTKINKNSFCIKLSVPFHKSTGPFLTHIKNNLIYFPLYRRMYLPSSEVSVHYLLLYNLSMLCRYESEWWGDLLSAKSDIDFPFISHFLSNTAEKIPLLLEEKLLERTSLDN
ncbi:YaaC-like Protein [Virgibacillus subterraneus]|uniref:YaaC-like Protein n=1 Tax=Virgibacillus subterraneus TaxID=621109 RepID=A0A1H8Z1I5_9BACI|nr:YaaC family protein [Virgibacillus subterraneus]SEP58182.1 YaaC-like Protein [Virgibacillus subterraneus]